MSQRNRHVRWWLLGGVLIVVMVAGLCAVIERRPAQLSAMEKLCVGSWSHRVPGDDATLIVYHFEGNGRAREEHYYLTSATPDTPGVTLVGRWWVESDGQLVVEASGGLTGMLDVASGYARDVFSDDQRFARPMLRRFYWIDQATEKELRVHANASGRGRDDFVMRPFHGMP